MARDTTPSQRDDAANTERTPLLQDTNTESPARGSDGGDFHKPYDVSAADPICHYRNVTRKQFWWVFGGLVFGDTIAFFDSTMMASAHPVITSYFHASNSASWLSTVFFLTTTIFQPLAGRMSDVVGRRPVYWFSIITFFLSTLWCAQAQSIESLIAARALCGLGAAGVITMSFVIISDIVKLEYRGIYQSILNTFYGLGHCMGASMGGTLCDQLGWRWAFRVQLPLIFIYLLIAIFTTPADLGPSLMKKQGQSVLQAIKAFDIWGSIALVFVITGLILGLNLGGNIFRWTHPIIITSLVCCAVAIPFLILIERRAQRPILPMQYFSTIPMGNVMMSNFLGAIVTQTVLFNAPLFLQAVLLLSPTKSGIYMMSPSIALTIVGVGSGLWITKSRNLKQPMILGALFLLLGASLPATMNPDSQTWVITCFLIPGASVAQGFLFPASTIAVLALSTQEDQAVVTTTLALLRNLGWLLGVAVSSWVLQNSLVATLDRYVTGPKKMEIISLARRNAQAVRQLTGHYQVQVVQAYAESLRYTFISGIVFAALVVILILPIRLVKLTKSSG